MESSPMHPLLIKSFPKTPRTQSEASQFGGSLLTKHNKTKQNKLPKTSRTRSKASQFGGSHNYKTKQNKLPNTPRTRSEASQFCGSHTLQDETKTKQTTVLHRETLFQPHP